MLELIWFFIMLIVAFYAAIILIGLAYSVFIFLIVGAVEVIKRALKIK